MQADQSEGMLLFKKEIIVTCTSIWQWRQRGGEFERLRRVKPRRLGDEHESRERTAPWLLLEQRDRQWCVHGETLDENQAWRKLRAQSKT